MCFRVQKCIYKSYWSELALSWFLSWVRRVNMYWLVDRLYQRRNGRNSKVLGPLTVRLFTHYNAIMICLLTSIRSFQNHYQSILPKGRSFTANSGTRVVVLLGMSRCGCFPLLSAPTLSLASEQTLKDLKRSDGTILEVRRVELANWALRTSPEFTTVVKDQFDQGFWPDHKSGNPNHPSLPL